LKLQVQLRLAREKMEAQFEIEKAEFERKLNKLNKQMDHIASKAQTEETAAFKKQLLDERAQLEARGRARTAAALQRALPRAFQCGQCAFGPILHSHCNDLQMHHGQRQGKGAIDNRCPRCGWFGRNIRDWPRWNGTLPTTAVGGELSEDLKELVRAHVVTEEQAQGMMRAPGWACQACTFRNKDADARCGICDTPHGGAVLHHGPYASPALWRAPLWTPRWTPPPRHSDFQRPYRVIDHAMASRGVALRPRWEICIAGQWLAYSPERCSQIAAAGREPLRFAERGNVYEIRLCPASQRSGYQENLQTRTRRRVRRV
jgi:rubrerythrin